MKQVSVATGSPMAVAVGKKIAAQGGNAVDSAIASTLVSMCTEPGVMAPGGSGFITIADSQGKAVVIDAYAEMPGRGLNWSELITDATKVFLPYGGGIETVIGYKSVATPGILSGLALASQKYGLLPWTQLLQPIIAQVEQGFPLSTTAANYLQDTQSAIFDWHPCSYQALHHSDGSPLKAGETVHIPDLTTSLQLMADQGVAALYQGALGRRITNTIVENQGILTSTDLAAYQSIERSPLSFRYGDWEIITNPAPAIGGACLASMLLLAAQTPLDSINAAARVETIAAIQRKVLDYRQHHFQTVENLDTAIANLLVSVGQQSPSTIHTSGVDSDGLGCSITASAGYGSGVMVPGTGLWLNNSLGELELQPQGFQGLQPGTRLISNMAPTIARHPNGTILVIGSPGASRITTAILQVLINFIQLGMPLAEAISYPRLHVEVFQEELSLAFEAGLNVPPLPDYQMRPFQSTSMYFGGVQVTLWHPETGLVAITDPRRAGSVGIFPE